MPERFGESTAPIKGEGGFGDEEVGYSPDEADEFDVPGEMSSARSSEWGTSSNGIDRDCFEEVLMFPSPSPSPSLTFVSFQSLHSLSPSLSLPLLSYCPSSTQSKTIKILYRQGEMY